QEQLAIDWRPVLGIVRGNDDVAVHPELLCVVLAYVRVVPVNARIRETQLVRKAGAGRHGRLHALVLAVRNTIEPMVQPQAMPMNRRVYIGVVGEVDRSLGALLDLERGPRD